jgi:hypothetical protein
MKLRDGLVKTVGLAVAVSLPLLGISAVATAAKPTTNAVGSAKWCAHHPKLAPKTPGCAASGGSGGTGSGGGGTGSGGPPPVITVQVDPNPAVEFGASEIFAVVQVEASPSFAGASVNIASSQLQSSCAILRFESIASGSLFVSTDSIQAVLDNDGNATVLMFGFACAPGRSVVEADLDVAPFATALGTLSAMPPTVTAPGLSGFPASSGTVTTGEVETGDTAASGDSNVYAVFYVETDPVYAEQQVEISAAQLSSRCLRGSEWLNSNSTVSNGSSSETLDDDGNAVFAFFGISCAAGTSAVIADVLAGGHQTYTGTFTVSPPAPTI